MGSYLSVRKITTSAGSISHFLLGGLAIAQYVRVIYAVPVPIEIGALAAAILA